MYTVVQENTCIWGQSFSYHTVGKGHAMFCSSCGAPSSKVIAASLINSLDTNVEMMIHTYHFLHLWLHHLAHFARPSLNANFWLHTFPQSQPINYWTKDTFSQSQPINYWTENIFSQSQPINLRDGKYILTITTHQLLERKYILTIQQLLDRKYISTITTRQLSDMKYILTIRDHQLLDRKYIHTVTTHHLLDWKYILTITTHQLLERRYILSRHQLLDRTFCPVMISQYGLFLL